MGKSQPDFVGNRLIDFVKTGSVYSGRHGLADNSFSKSGLQNDFFLG